MRASAAARSPPCGCASRAARRTSCSHRRGRTTTERHGWPAALLAGCFLPFAFYAKTTNVDLPFVCWFAWSLVFLVVDPFVAAPGYEVDLGPFDLAELRAETPADVLVLAIVTLDHDERRARREEHAEPGPHRGDQQ